MSAALTFEAPMATVEIVLKINGKDEATDEKEDIRSMLRDLWTVFPKIVSAGLDENHLFGIGKKDDVDEMIVAMKARPCLPPRWQKVYVRVPEVGGDIYGGTKVRHF